MEITTTIIPETEEEGEPAEGAIIIMITIAVHLHPSYLPGILTTMTEQILIIEVMYVPTL